MSGQLLTTRQAASLLACSEKTLCWWGETGLVPRVKMNRLVRWKREDLEAFIDANRQPSGQGKR